MNSVKIKYCTQCGWLLRTSWMAQELLHTFPNEINELTLIPATGGVFEISVNDKLIWSREENGGFPEIKILKRIVRDLIAPNKSLGHTDQ